MIQCVLFDIDDTLLNHQQGHLYAMDWLESFLASHDYASGNDEFERFHQFYDEMNQRLWSQFEGGGLSVESLLSQRFQHVFDWFGVRRTHRDEIESTFICKYAQSCVPTGPWLNILKYFRQRGIILGVCSNGAERVQRLKLEASQLASYFDYFFFGFCAPQCKPHESFYQHVKRELDVAFEDILMVGDSLENDVLPCQKLGIKVHHFSKRADFSKSIASLMEIVDAG
ncbi:HAD family hydrolase [Pseudomonas sp. P9_31]|uniref:HAD family hydrolase n=1 Tax=Pseudomonas sp. P9_31 TaxID=3043448 RepID=UPI002A35B5E7|nr:HAD family hydrolase [Pseudomonas sp. P9_31]WPN60553.1 HAD family hydrolase [Pseudomonas sp. P9_31]